MTVALISLGAEARTMKDGHDDRYVGLIEWLVSESAGAKLLDLLINCSDFEYSSKELAESAGVSERAVMRQIPKLVEVGLVRQTRRAGRTVFMFNSGSEGARLLERTVFCLATVRIEKSLSGQGHAAAASVQAQR